MNIPLHEAIRPRGNRDDAGVKDEALHQLADWLEVNCKEQGIPKTCTRQHLWEALLNNQAEVPDEFLQALEVVQQWAEKAPTASVR